jgi:hypothetical protein
MAVNRTGFMTQLVNQPPTGFINCDYGSLKTRIFYYFNHSKSIGEVRFWLN